MPRSLRYKRQYRHPTTKSIQNLQELQEVIKEDGPDTEINFHGRINALSLEEAVALLDALKRENNIKRLYLVRSYPQKLGWMNDLSEAISRSRSLEGLYLGHNGFSPTDTGILADGLRSNNKISVLDLSGNRIGSEGVSHLSNAISNGGGIRELCLRINALQGESVAVLAPIFSGETATVKCLDLSSNMLDDDSALSLADMLGTADSPLEFLDLSNNRIGSAGARSLASGLCRCSCFEGLILDNNHIGSGLDALADMARCSNTLLELHVSSNNISASGAVYLAEALRECPSFETLDISCNKIGSDGAKALAETTKLSGTFFELNVSMNNIDEEGMVALAETFANSPSLQKLHVGKNKANTKITRAFANAGNIFLKRSQYKRPGLNLLFSALNDPLTIFETLTGIFLGSLDGEESNQCIHETISRFHMLSVLEACRDQKQAMLPLLVQLAKRKFGLMGAFMLMVSQPDLVAWTSPC